MAANPNPDADGVEEEADGLHRPLAPVLWMTMLVLAISPFLATSPLGRVATSVLVGGTAVLALRRSNARRAVVLGGEVIVVVATVLSIATRELGDTQDSLTTLATALFCLLLLVTPVVVVARLTSRPRITIDTVAGALAAYVQIGLFFAALYRLTQILTDAPFFAEVQNATAMDFQFFSFVTLTTLGYGNLVPAEDLGQSFALFEAIIGQVFLVTVVALAVGRLGATTTAAKFPRDRPQPGDA